MPYFLKNIFVLFFLAFTLSAYGQAECNCSEAFKEVQKIAEESYAGYEYNINLHGKRNHRKLCRKTKKMASTSNTIKDCETLLNEYITFFNDKHFNLISDDFMQHLEASNAPPEFKILKDGKVSYIKIPSFDLEYKASIDSLVSTNHQQIIQSEIFVIDISYNEGGGDDCYSALSPYCYTNPFTVEGVDLKISDGNIAEFEKFLTYTDYFDEETLKSIQTWVDKGKAAKGTFANMEVEQVITLDTMYNVPKVALIITEAKSAAEGLILEAMQSKKVTTFGRNSGGVRDFMNVRHQKLKSCEITIGLPTTKSTRVPENAIDGVGIKPDVVQNFDDVIEKNTEKILTHYKIE